MAYGPAQGFIASGVSLAAFPLLIPAGTAGAPSLAQSGAATTGIYFPSSVTVAIASNGFDTARFDSDSLWLKGNNHSLEFGSTIDVALIRDGAAGILAQRVSTAAQILRVYNTWTDASNGEWFQIDWQTSANVCILRTAENGTGTNRVLQLNYSSDSTISALLIPIAKASEIVIGDSGSTGTVTGGTTGRFGHGNTLTATSGSELSVRLGASYSPSSSSTMSAVNLQISSTINYAAGGAGRVQLLRLVPTNTALPTGNNAAIALSATASALGGIHFHNQTDEATNFEYVKLGFTSNTFEILTVAGGSGTLRDVAVKAGNGTARPILGGRINIQTTEVGNTDAGEHILFTYDLPTDSFNVAGKSVHITVWGTTANNANAKTIKLYFGSVILTNALTINLAGIWRVEADVISTGTDAQDYVAQLVTTGAAGVALNDIEQGALTENDGAAITIKITGEATTTNDIIAKGMKIIFNG